MGVVVRLSERVTIIGPTGSGKSVLALSYVCRAASGIVLDVKHEITLPGWAVTTDPQELWTTPRLIWRPAGTMDPIVAGGLAGAAALARGETVLYLDEAALVAPGQRIHDHLRAAIMTGRSRGVAVWAATQRPVLVSNLLFSEAQAFFAAPLTLASDRQKVAGWIPGYDAWAQQDWPPHTFAFWRSDVEAIVPVRLALSSMRSRRRRRVIPMEEVS
jgi:hypothetical protein